MVLAERVTMAALTGLSNILDNFTKPSWSEDLRWMVEDDRSTKAATAGLASILDNFTKPCWSEALHLMVADNKATKKPWSTLATYFSWDSVQERSTNRRNCL